MNSYVQKFRYVATGRWAVSLRTYLLVFPFGYLVSTERELIYDPLTLSKAALIALAGEMASFLYLFLAQSLLLKNRRQHLQPIWRCFFVWASTGLVRGLGVAAYANWAFGYDWRLWQRIPSATVYTTVVMALAATYFGTIERRRTEFQAMVSLNDLLANDESELLAQDLVRRTEAQAVLEGELLPQVEQLRKGITEAIASSHDKNSDQILDDLYERSFRISQELESQRRILESSPTSARKTNSLGNTITYWQSLTPKILSVRITLIFFTLGTFSGQFPRNGIEGVAAGLIGMIPLLIVLLPFSQIIKRIRRWKSPVFVSAFISVFAVSYLYNRAQIHFGFTLKHPYAPWYSAAKTIYGLYFASVVASLLVDFGDKRKVASIVGATHKTAVEKLSNRNYALERAVISGRFGTLQGKISGVTMALHLLRSQSLGAISEERKMTLLMNANELLADSLNEINALKVGALS